MHSHDASPLVFCTPQDPDLTDSAAVCSIPRTGTLNRRHNPGPAPGTGRGLGCGRQGAGSEPGARCSSLRFPPVQQDGGGSSKQTAERGSGKSADPSSHEGKCSDLSHDSRKTQTLKVEEAARCLGTFSSHMGVRAERSLHRGGGGVGAGGQTLTTVQPSRPLRDQAPETGRL